MIEHVPIYRYALIMFAVIMGTEGSVQVSGQRYPVGFEALADCERVSANVLAPIDVPEGQEMYGASIPLDQARPRS